MLVEADAGSGVFAEEDAAAELGTGTIGFIEVAVMNRAAGAESIVHDDRLTHRPRELPTPDRFELAYDGLELDV